MKMIKIVLTDLAGLGLIILSVLTGWIPGPGGIPLFIAGLGLLAINHEWARQLLRKAKRQGLKFADKFFRDHPVLMLTYDLVAVSLIGVGILLLIQIHGILKTIAFMLIIVGLSLFLGNRRRLQKIRQHFRKQT